MSEPTKPGDFGKRPSPFSSMRSATTHRPKFIANFGIGLVACALALTACTNASTPAVPGPSGSASAAIGFDPGSVQKDESLASQTPAAIKSKGTLVIGSDTTYAPAEFVGGADNRTPMGYGVDIAKAIGATLDLEVDVQTAEFTGILPALGPKYDLGISSLSITKDRLQAVNFVSYLDAGTSWAVRTGNPKNFSLDDVCGTSIGVQTGTTQEDPDVKDRNEECVKAGKNPIDIVTLKNQTDVTTRLLFGNLDAMIAESTLIDYAIQQSGGMIQKVGGNYNTLPVGIAVAKNDPAFADLIQKVVTKLMADGTYKKVLDTWNNTDNAITKSEVNPSLTP